MMKAHIFCTSGYQEECCFQETITVAAFYIQIANKTKISLSGIGAIIVNNRKLELCGLANKISEVFNINLSLKIFVLQRIGYSHVVNSVISLYHQALDLGLRLAIEETCANCIDLLLKELNDVFVKTRREETNILNNRYKLANDVDPLTKKKIVFCVRWIQDGMLYEMEYGSVLDHVRRNKFLDENGRAQIKNPITERIIPFPWNQALFCCISRL